MKQNTLIAFCIVFISVLSGCTPSPQQTRTIVVWHWMTGRDKTFKTLAEKYRQETDVTVRFELYAPSDVYSQKIIAAAQAKRLPDLFGILDTKEVLAKFIKSGYIADLTPYFEENDAEWDQIFFAKALNTTKFEPGNAYGVKPGQYGVPIDVMNIQMLYNRKLLEKAGITAPPQTFDEFIEDARALRRVGITPFVSGWGELWLVDCFASNYAFNMMGEEKIFATFRGEVPYTDPDWIRVLKIFEKLRENDVLIEGIVTKGNKYAEQDFALERAAFAFNGSWCVNVYHDMNGNLDYGTMMPPAADSRYPMKIWGAAGSSFYVNHLSFQKDEAVKFLKWFTAKEQQDVLSDQTENLPSNRKAAQSTLPVLSEFAASMDLTTHPTIWPIIEDAEVMDKFGRGIQSIIIGEKTAEEVALEVQAQKEKVMAKKFKK